ncbi:MAG: branched-chain-amino-acid transaminase [Firmicutes bacterium]|nr:branched-chain-amino-acid transaminase [Bacillota bacterium]
MAKFIWLDGSLVPTDQAKVSVFDHGLLYGDGVFEGIRGYSGRVFKLTEHLDRLYENAHSIALEIPLTWKEMEKAVLDTVRANDLRDCYIRLVVTRGVGDLGLDPRKCQKATVFIIADTITLFPEELYTRGLAIVSVSTRRTAVDALNPRLKPLNYLNNVLAKLLGNLAGVPEVVMLSPEGYVVEGTGDNIFIVRRGRLITPPLHLGVLEGITRALIMDIGRSMGIPVAEEMFTLHDMYVAEECFLTGTAAEVIPVVNVDGRKIGRGTPGPITAGLIKAFREITKTTGTPVYPEKVEAEVAR